MQPDQSPRPGSAANSASPDPATRLLEVGTSAHDLTSASFTQRSNSYAESLSTLRRVADRLNCCSFRTELMTRIEEASSPLPSSIERDIEAAHQRLNTMAPLERIDIFQKLFSPRILERSGWALPGSPFVAVHGVMVPPELQLHSTGLIHELLERGSLPPLHSYQTIHAIAGSIPRYKTATTRTLAVVGMVATAAAAFFGPPLLPALVAIPAILCVRYSARKPDIHAEFATGCLLEAMDANKVLHDGEKPPSLRSTLDSYFHDPFIPASYLHPIQSEGFLAARTLRIFGYSGIEILSTFMERDAIKEKGSMVFTLLTEIFREQDIDYTTPLATIFRTPSEGTNAAIISLLEDVNAAHFAWALRDKDQLRHDAARMILERPTEQPQTA